MRRYTPILLLFVLHSALNASTGDTARRATPFVVKTDLLAPALVFIDRSFGASFSFEKFLSRNKSVQLSAIVARLSTNDRYIDALQLIPSVRWYILQRGPRSAYFTGAYIRYSIIRESTHEAGTPPKEAPFHPYHRLAAGITWGHEQRFFRWLVVDYGFGFGAGYVLNGPYSAARKFRSADNDPLAPEMLLFLNLGYRSRK